MGGAAMARTRNYADVIRKELAEDADLLDSVEEEIFHAELAMKLQQIRKAAGLTQKKLAEMIKTQQSVISRIEDSDYDGHSLSVVRKIATALGKRIRIVIEDYPTDGPATAEIAELLNPPPPSGEAK
jgi:DNA-binding XRE family transcriptional regulator